MAFINIGTGDDLVLEIPVKRTVDWADKLREDCFQRIVEHDHSGSGRGRPLSGEGIADNGIDDRKILLRNNEWLRSAGVNPGDPDQNILRVNPTGDLEIAPQKLVMSNGVILNNNGAFASRVEGELTVSDDLVVEGKLIAPQPILTPLEEDPSSPDEGQLQVSDGTDRDKGLWLYQDGNWVAPGVPDESITTAKLQDNSVTEPKLADDSVPTRAIIDKSVTEDKLADEVISNLFYPPYVQEIPSGTSSIIYDGVIKTYNLGKASPPGATLNFYLEAWTFDERVIQIFVGGEAEIKIFLNSTSPVEILSIDLSTYTTPIKIDISWDYNLEPFICIAECL